MLKFRVISLMLVTTTLGCGTGVQDADEGGERYTVTPRASATPMPFGYAHIALPAHYPAKDT